MSDPSSGPVYLCSKKVRAQQIAGVHGYWLTFTTPGVQPLEVPPVMFARREPEVGDYLVTYEDGYQSISPKAVFEDGYKLQLVNPDLFPPKPEEAQDGH